MTAIDLMVATWFLAQSPVTITFTPPVVGEVQVLRVKRDSTVGDQKVCIISTRHRWGDCHRCTRVSEVLERQTRVLTVRGGVIRSYQVTYQRSAVGCAGLGSPPPAPSSPVEGLTFVLRSTPPGISVTTALGAPATRVQERELLDNHEALLSLRDLHLARSKLTVTRGTRVSLLENALMPLWSRFWLSSLRRSRPTVHFYGVETRRGRSVVIFSVNAGEASGPGFPVYQGHLGLDLQTGRLAFLELWPATRPRDLVPKYPFPSTRLSIKAEYH